MAMVPDYDEDPNEVFSGPYEGALFNDEIEDDETWDDATEAPTAALYEEERPALPRVGSDFTHCPGAEEI